MTVRRVLLLMCLLLWNAAALPAMAGTTAPDSITIRLLEAATARADDPRSRIYINDHLEPGAGISRRIQVTNTTGSAQDLAFYPAAAELADGSFSIADGRAGNELTTWMAVEPRTTRLADGEDVEITVRLKVPDDASPGERYAAVIAEVVTPPPAPGGVRTASRLGIRVYLSVGPGGEPASDFLVDSVAAGRAPDGSALVEAEVRNTGGRALDLAGELRLSDGPGGLSAGPYDVRVGTTLGVGQSAPVGVVLDEAIRGGPWTATLTLRSGLLERSARAQITFPDDAGGQAAPVQAENLSPAEDPKIIVPIAVSLILLIALLLAWGLIARRWTDRRKDEDHEPVPTG